MVTRPMVVAFDVIETLFPLDALRGRLADVGLRADLLDLWFARLLRDAFALAASGGYARFAEVASATLRSTAGVPLDDDAVRSVLGGFAELDPHPDVIPAVRLGHQHGLRLVALTNGTADNTTALLHRAGVLDYFEHVLSVEHVRRWKPAPQIYRHAVDTTAVPADRVALVAVHAWDIHGAHQAGLTTGWVARSGHTFPDMFSPPDITGHDLVDTVQRLVSLPNV